MPLRNSVIVALDSLATWRKCENSFWLSSPTPSHEKTTNCGGVSPGFSFSIGIRFGCTPVLDVEPSPIRVTAAGGGAACTDLSSLPAAGALELSFLALLSSLSLARNTNPTAARTATTTSRAAPRAERTTHLVRRVRNLMDPHSKTRIMRFLTNANTQTGVSQYVYPLIVDQCTYLAHNRHDAGALPALSPGPRGASMRALIRHRITHLPVPPGAHCR